MCLFDNFIIDVRLLIYIKDVVLNWLFKYSLILWI